MQNVIQTTWDALAAEIAKHVENIESRLEPPASLEDIAVSEKTIGMPLPAELKAMYKIHNGLDVSGFLPDVSSNDKDMTFSILSAAEVGEYFDMYDGNAAERGGLWKLFPHWLKALTAGNTAGGLWKQGWIPFATDGGGDVQCIDINKGHRIIQYEHETFRFKKCARSLPNYFQNIATKIANRKLRVFNID